VYIYGTTSLTGVEYFFIRRETTAMVEWYVFNYSGIIGGKEYQLSLKALSEFKGNSISPFLVSAHQMSATELKIYGNPAIVNRLINAYSKATSGLDEGESSREIQSDGLILSNSYEEGMNSCNIKHLYKTLKNSHLEEYKKESLEKGKEVDLNKTNVFNSVKSIAEEQMKKERLKKNPKFKGSMKLNSNIIHLDFRQGDILLKTINYSMGNTKGLKLDWETIDLNETFKNKKMEAILASTHKSIPQLRMIYDLSWFFDPKGRMHKNYKIINTVEDMQYYAKNVFPKVKLWAVDIETTGLKMFKGFHRENFDHTVSIMVSWEKDQALFFPIDMLQMANLPYEGMQILKPWLEKIPAVGHNVTFDARGLLVDFGINLNIQHDTMQLNFNVNTHRAKYLGNALKKLEHRYFKIDTLELKDIFGTSKKAGLFRHLPPLLALMYACPDVDYDLQLLKVLWKELPASCRKAYKLDMATAKHVYKMDIIGNRVDTEKAKKFRTANNVDRETLAQLIYKLAGQTIAKNEKVHELAMKYSDGILTSDEELIHELEVFEKSETFNKAKRMFDINSTKQLGDIIFRQMGYPIVEYSSKSKLPKIDSGVLKKLMDVKNKSQTGWLLKDIPSAFSKFQKRVKPLVDAAEINEMEYPLALLIVEYRLRDKRDGTFYHQILDGAIEGRYYTSTKMANAETFRIINTIQTLQGFMKQLIIPYDDEYYKLVFDFSQIEYRYMAGMANVVELVKSLNGPRADFHKECCALLHNIMPWHVTSKMRKEGKSLNFAIPYGMGVFSICQNLFGKVTELLKIEAQHQLNTWQDKFHLIWEYLETKRDFALENGYVENDLGRRRCFFDGTSMDDEIYRENLNTWIRERTSAAVKAIRRASGNFPIQSGAADLFKLALCNFRERLEREGLADLVKTTALIHDEIVSSVHKSVNPYYLYKIIYEECMLVLTGHPRYYAGVSIVDNWEEGKADEYEAPIEFIQHILKSGKADKKFVYQEDAKNTVYNDIKEFMTNLFFDEYSAIGVDFEGSTFNVKEILDKCKDYFVLDKVSVYFPLPEDGSHGKLIKKYDNDKFIRGFEEFILATGKHDNYLFIYPEDYPEGTMANLSDRGREFLGKEGNNLQIFLSKDEVEDIKKSKDTNMDLDLDFDMDEEYEEDDMAGDMFTDVRLDALFKYELDEEEDNLFNNEGVFVYTHRSLEVVDDDEGSPEDYVDIHSTEEDLVRVSNHSIYINIGKINRDVRQDAMDYINKYAVSTEELGSVEIVLKTGVDFNYTGVFIKGYNLLELKEFLYSLDKNEVYSQ